MRTLSHPLALWSGVLEDAALRRSLSVVVARPNFHPGHQQADFHHIRAGTMRKVQRF